MTVIDLPSSDLVDVFLSFGTTTKSVGGDPAKKLFHLNRLKAVGDSMLRALPLGISVSCLSIEALKSISHVHGDYKRYRFVVDDDTELTGVFPTKVLHDINDALYNEKLCQSDWSIHGQ